MTLDKTSPMNSCVILNMWRNH